MRASSPLNSGFSYRLETGGGCVSALVNVPAYALSLWCFLRNRRTRMYSSIPASDTPTVTPTPTPAFVLELSPEGVIPWSVGGLLEEDVEGGPAGFVWEAIVEVDGGAVVFVGATVVAI